MTYGSTVDELGEHALLARLRARVPPPPGAVRLGLGDDAALVAPEPRTLDVLTTDALVEGVHFDRAFVAARDVGYRALAVNLSDLAAMGALPRVALLSLGLPPGFPVADFDALVEGWLELAARARVALVGGNLTRTGGPLFVDVTAIGAVHPRRALTRAGARPGDELYVSGPVGGAAAGLAWLQARSSTGAPMVPDDEVLADAVRRYCRPEPRVRLGLLVGRNRAASACMDLSDGLADAVRQLAQASGTGADVEAGAVPCHAALRVALPDGDPVRAALGAGDDYELLFAVAPRRRRAFAAAAARAGAEPVRIGALTRGSALRVVRGSGVAPLEGGYVHFG